MSFSQLSKMKEFLNEDEFKKTMKYFTNTSHKAIINPSNFVFVTSLSNEKTKRVFDYLKNIGVLDYVYSIRCPECGFLIKSVNSVSDIESEVFCYNCEENVQIGFEDVDVLYRFINYPFNLGQQNKKTINDSVAQQQQKKETLIDLVRDGKIDLNQEFFDPTDQEYLELEKKYNSIFLNQKTTKKKGDALEDLVSYLFDLCKHFRVNTQVRTKHNQIDCYVRNTIFLPGVSNADCKDHFLIECKNENSTPKKDYINKLHSVLSSTSSNFGIIVTKVPAPKTYSNFANQVFLSSKIIIICIDKNDLESIIIQHKNLLEMIERKICELQLNATKDLKELGLYKA